MLSRVADAIYWMGRYVERAENLARILEVSHEVMLDLATPDHDPWHAVLNATGDEDLFAARHGHPTRDGVFRFLTFDPASDNSILSCMRKARENARSVREVISSEMWEQINKAYLLACEAETRPEVLGDPHEFLSAVKNASHSIVGATYLTMTHHEGWHFGRLGRLLERADQTSRILDAKHALLQARGESPAALGESHGAALLRSVSGLEMYRQAHGLITASRVVGFLVLDKKFPRSMRYCLNKGERSLHAITGTPLGSPSCLAERKLGRLNAECEYASVEEILAEGLHTYLDTFQTKLNGVGSAIYESFFATAVVAPPAEAGPQADADQ
jgi:uncharacterized alpha-E superfamily protein